MDFQPAKLKPKTIPRADGISRRLVAIGMGGRFTDELLSGVPDVLMPSIRARLGLSYAQISLLYLALSYVAAIVEPVGGILIDLWQRRWLMAFGAMILGLAIAVIGFAPTFLILLLGFALYGLGSGPLAHTADVVLVEAHPAAPDRIFARATLFDTMGALLGPLAVTAVGILGLDWRWLMAALALFSFSYAGLIWRTRFPRLAGNGRESGESFLTVLRSNIGDVLSNRTALLWLLFLFVHELQELPAFFTTVWLREQVGMSQALIGVYRAGELVVSMAALIYLDRWRRHSHYKQVLWTAGLGILLLYPAWLLLPGVATRFILGIPLNFLLTVYWPIGKAQSLVTVPGKAGTVTAVHSLIGFIPMSLLFGLLAEWISLTTAMLWVHVGATVALTLTVFVLPDENG